MRLPRLAEMSHLSLAAAARIHLKKLIIFDLDGTLAESKSALDPEMTRLLGALLGSVRVAVISGGAWPQFEKQLIAGLPPTKLNELSLLPTCGTKFYRYESGWQLLYSEDFSAAEKLKIIACLERVLAETGFTAAQTWGEQIEDRGSQVTFSALGQQAPYQAKKTWDPDFKKRQTIKALLSPLIPEFSIGLGGATSIDVTKPGIDKAYGIRKLRDTLGIPITDMLFVGDALFPGGNDQPARETGVTCIQVKDPEQTKRVIETIVACAGGAIPS
jgi:phosphomannomutase